jgi:hypothetical protein
MRRGGHRDGAHNFAYLDSSFERHGSILSLPRTASVRAIRARRALTAAISPASVLERVVLRAMRESARGKPISASGLRWASEVIGFPSRRSDPIRHHCVLSEQSSVSFTGRRGPQPAVRRVTVSLGRRGRTTPLVQHGRGKGRRFPRASARRACDAADSGRRCPGTRRHTDGARDWIWPTRGNCAG